MVGELLQRNKNGAKDRKVDKYLPHESVTEHGLCRLFILNKKESIILNGIGELFRVTREEAGVSIGEASKDLDIKEVILENIEDGNIGCFKDIYVLKDYIYNYSKYLGIDADKVIDDFNEYMFEYTSRIPIDEIEKKIQEQNSAKNEKNEISSPYTKEYKKQNKSIYVLLYCVIIFVIMFVVFWSIKQITVNKETASFISYVK